MDIKSVLAGEAGWALVQGDCLDVLRLMPDACVDAVVTDPPSGTGFMGKDWDHDKGGRDAWIAWLSEMMAECLRVLKPGGHALVWGLPRTSHWTAMALEDAGFEIRDSLHHLFGTGFNKSANHLKPAHEVWWLCRKPLDGTVAANTLRHGCGGLNIDGCRVGDALRINQPAGNKPGGNAYMMGVHGMPQDAAPRAASGRWPTNLLFSHSPDCADECIEQCPVAELDRQSGILKSNSGAPFQRKANTGNGLTHGIMKPVDAQGYYGDIGGASRFFPVFRYQSKPSRRERSYGLPDGQRSTHPTVKSIELMRWLCRLITPPNGVVLDPFAGSGSTGLACLAEGFRFIGIEREAEYIESARRRLIAADTDRLGPLFSSSPAAAR